MSTKLVLTFIGSDDKNVKLNYNYVDTEVEQSDIQTLTQTIITNGSIFTNPPVKAKKATISVTTNTDIPLNN